MNDLAVELAALDTRRRVIDALSECDESDAMTWLWVKRYLSDLERAALARWRIH
jgi:hypothetical protein